MLQACQGIRPDRGRCGVMLPYRGVCADHGAAQEKKRAPAPDVILFKYRVPTGRAEALRLAGVRDIPRNYTGPADFRERTKGAELAGTRIFGEGGIKGRIALYDVYQELIDDGLYAPGTVFRPVGLQLEPSRQEGWSNVILVLDREGDEADLTPIEYEVGLCWKYVHVWANPETLDKSGRLRITHVVECLFPVKKSPKIEVKFDRGLWDLIPIPDAPRVAASS